MLPLSLGSCLHARSRHCARLNKEEQISAEGADTRGGTSVVAQSAPGPNPERTSRQDSGTAPSGLVGGLVASACVGRRDFHDVHRHIFGRAHGVIFRANSALDKAKSYSRSIRFHSSLDQEVCTLHRVFRVLPPALSWSAKRKNRLELDVGIQRLFYCRWLLRSR